MSERLTITPLGPYIGAQVSGLDVTRPLSDNQFEQLYHAVLRHQVVFLREQAITRSSSARWRYALAICISIRSIRMRKGWRRLSSWIPITIIRRIMTTGTPM
jgi:alpha-ketoglutarate-dependent taurine dioxygenase